MFIQQSTTAPLPFLLISSSDHITGVAGATATVTLSKNGGSFVSAGGTVTELANGWYKLTPTTTDTGTLGALAIHVSATGADPSDTLYEVVAFNPNDGAAGVWNAALSSFTDGTKAGGALANINSKMSLLALMPLNIQPTQYTVLPQTDVAVSVVQGDDYNTDTGVISFSSTNWVTLPGGSTVELTVRTADTLETLVLQISGTITSSGSTQTLKFQPTHTQTAAMPIATHNFAVQAAFPDGSLTTLVLGTFTVIDGITNS